MKTGEVRVGFLEVMLEHSPERPGPSDKLEGWKGRSGQNASDILKLNQGVEKPHLLPTSEPKA